jgi:hypothetical protein
MNVGNRKRSDKIIMIDGKGKRWDQIASEYVDYFSRGYTYTFEDLADYLRCGYPYIQRNVAWEIEHIYINTSVNQMLYKYFKDEVYGHGINDRIDEYHFSLITKKFLFRWKDIEQYFLNEMSLVTPKGEIERLGELPDQLVSVKDLMDEGEFYRFRYEAYFYRYIQKKKIPKIKYKNLVRYYWSDFE